MKEKMMNYFLPIVAIGTVADCVPLLDENRLLVQK
jgi:single-stranded DNA-specific DHH superfamily exonuclease